MRQGKSQALVPKLAKLANGHPGNAGLRILLGVAFLDLKDLDKAEASVRQPLAIDVDVKDAYTSLGNVDLARGSMESAKAHFRTAIQTDPNDLTNYLTLENQYEQEGNWDGAKKSCEQARRTNPESPVAAFVLRTFTWTRWRRQCRGVASTDRQAKDAWFSGNG